MLLDSAACLAVSMFNPLVRAGRARRWFRRGLHVESGPFRVPDQNAPTARKKAMMFDSFTNWRNWLALEAAHTTIEAYAYEMGRLMQFHPGRDPIGFDLNDLTAYLAKRIEDGLGPAAVYRATNALRSFYKFHYGSESPARKLPLKKPKWHKQRSLSLEQVSDLLVSIDTSTPIGKRNLALVSFMIDTGFRASEICRLNDVQVDLKTRLAWVKIKGGQDGFGAFSEETAAYCATWRAVRSEMTRCEAFFVGFELHRPGNRLTREGLTDIIRSIGKGAGLRLSPHDLRRTFATLSILMGAPSRLVQIAGRWSDLKLVERYTQTITAKAIDPYSPISAAARRVEH
jgi:site-specific recombinase XerD